MRKSQANPCWKKHCWSEVTLKCFSADDSVTKRRVAIKKVTNTFSDLTDAKRIMREIKLLGQLGDHENVIGLVDVMTMPPPLKLQRLFHSSH